MPDGDEKYYPDVESPIGMRIDYSLPDPLAKECYWGPHRIATTVHYDEHITGIQEFWFPVKKWPDNIDLLNTLNVHWLKQRAEAYAHRGLSRLSRKQIASILKARVREKFNEQTCSRPCVLFVKVDGAEYRGSLAYSWSVLGEPKVGPADGYGFIVSVQADIVVRHSFKVYVRLWCAKGIPIGRDPFDGDDPSAKDFDDEEEF